MGGRAKERRIKIAILDDYQNFALRFADWSKVKARAEVTVFDRHLTTSRASAGGIKGWCCMPEL